jgi:competence protein ComGC
MKKIIALSIIVTAFMLTVVLVDGCGKKTAPVPAGKIVSAEKTSFADVTSKLDAGGSFYLYLSTEQWLNNLSGQIGTWHGMIDAIPNLQDEQRQHIEDAFNVATNLIKDSGLEQISGIGMSSIAREPGFYFNKMIVHHYPGQANGFIWTLFGQEPHPLDGLDLLPTNTAMAVFYDLDAAQAWAVIQKECGQSGFPQAADFLKTFPEQFEKGAGIKWDDVIASLGGEFGVVLTLDDSRIVRIPLPSQDGLEIPEPGLMIVAKVKNEAIFNRIDEAIKKSGQGRVITVNQNGIRMFTMPVPIPLPLTLRPTIASSQGYLFLASNDALILEALGVKGGKPGLKSTEEFKKLAVDLPEQGNQFCFLSQRFGQTFVKIQREALSMNKQAPPQMKELLQSFMQPEKAAYTYAVGANTDEGWITVANGNQGSGKIVAASAAIPVVLATIAIPNFIKARETAQKNACINNLRMIDAAKQQWALEKSKKASDVPTMADLQPYLKARQTLRCPAGGRYTIGSVAESPRCSIPGHELPY